MPSVHSIIYKHQHRKKKEKKKFIKYNINLFEFISYRKKSNKNNPWKIGKDKGQESCYHNRL